MIIDNNTVGPSGYFVDYVRCFKVEAKPTQKEKDLYKECYDSLHAGIEMMKPGNTTKDVAEKFPVYDDDKYGTVTLQQFAHSIGLTLYEGMWVSRAYSLKYPAEIKTEYVLRYRNLCRTPRASANRQARTGHAGHRYRA